jgi:hypothetical protein
VKTTAAEARLLSDAATQNRPPKYARPHRGGRKPYLKAMHFSVCYMGWIKDKNKLIPPSFSVDLSNATFNLKAFIIFPVTSCRRTCKTCCICVKEFTLCSHSNGTISTFNDCFKMCICGNTTSRKQANHIPCLNGWQASFLNYCRFSDFILPYSS